MIHSPSPEFVASLVVKNGSNARARAVALIPDPLSEIRTVTPSSPVRGLMPACSRKVRILGPELEFIASIAFEIKLAADVFVEILAF